MTETKILNWPKLDRTDLHRMETKTLFKLVDRLSDQVTKMECELCLRGEL